MSTLRVRMQNKDQGVYPESTDGGQIRRTADHDGKALTRLQVARGRLRRWQIDYAS